MSADDQTPFPSTRHDPYAALRFRNFRLYLGGNVLAILGLQMQSVAVGWEIWNRTRNALALSWVGLIQVLPVLLLALVAGHVADRVDRRRIVMVCLVIIIASSIGLAWLSQAQGPVPGVAAQDKAVPTMELTPKQWTYIIAMYGCLLAAGIARAFQQPAKASFLPLLVPHEVFPNAVTWNITGLQLASVLGPAAAGFMIYYFDGSKAFPFRDWVNSWTGGKLSPWYGTATPVYVLDASAALLFFGLLSQVQLRPHVAAKQAATFHSLVAGIVFLWENKILLGAMALDMFAVLLGGATMLLPVYATEILKVGVDKLGWMQAAPAVGALCMSFLMAHRPLEHAGRALLLAVFGFGVATIIFGFSRSFWLSLTALFLTGVFDNVSVIVRHTLVQVLTPDHMRGRVSAVNGMFIGASNELGGFESAFVAWLFTPMISVVGGGVGTIVVVAIIAWLIPPLRRYGRLVRPP